VLRAGTIPGWVIDQRRERIYDEVITWSTYTVDGRTLVVDRMPDGRWLARCEDGPEELRLDLTEAILAASRADLGLVSGDVAERWVRWAGEHAARISAEALDEE
jgi:hypothetical protein